MSRIRSIMENVADGLVTFDEAGIIETVNPAVELLFGYSAEELMGENISILMPESDDDGQAKIFDIGPQEATWRRKDGSTFEIELAVSEMSLGEKRIFIGTIRDATARNKAHAILRAAKQEAEQANFAKSKFFAVASHDLRQPLHAMSLFLPLLSKRITTDKSREIIDAIGESCDAMSGLLEALLDISKLDAGIVTPEVRSVAVGPLMRSLGTEFAPQALEKGLDLRVIPVDLWVSTDPKLLSRILRNLLSNAIQNTTQGRVFFGARRRGTGLRFEVWDTGVGIAANKTRDIFQEFYQIGNPERNRAQGLGLGLGLAVVSRLSVLLGHRIGVKSTPGRGSVFSIEVPTTRSSAADENKAGPAISQINGFLTGKVVVLIDDEAAVRKGTRMNLEDWGCQVLVAKSCDEALIGIGGLNKKPDVILADYRLRGEETGFVTIERIYRFVGAQIPAVIITGDTDPKLVREAAAKGYGLVHKPVTPESLYQVLQNAIRGARKRTERRGDHKHLKIIGNSIMHA